MFFTNSLAAQDSLRVEKFNELSLRVQEMMSKKGTSLEHLTVVFRQLSEYSDIDQSSFQEITERRYDYNLSERIRYVESKSKEYKLQQALVSMAILENEYKDNNVIKNLGLKTRSKARKKLIKNLKESRVRYTLEPSFSYYTLGKKPSEFAFFNSPGMRYMFSLGGYKTFGLKATKRTSDQQNYVYSQAGVKVDYFYGMLNPQISTLFTQTSGIDIGYAFNFGDKQGSENYYTINIAAYYPMDFLSLGVNARLLSDLSENHYLHYGLTLKYNLKLGTKVTEQELSKIDVDLKNINFTPFE